MKNDGSISRHLSHVLRHSPDSIGLNLDRGGWADVEQLIARSNEAGHVFDRVDLERVVETSNKRRAVRARIRAVRFRGIRSRSILDSSQ